MEFLWKYLFESVELKEDHASKAVIAFIDIFKHSAFTYFRKIVDNLHQGKMGDLNIKIAHGFLKETSNLQFVDILQEDY